MAGARAQPCSSFIMTGWSFEAAEQAGLKGRSSLAGEEGKTTLAGDGGARKDIGRTGSLGSTCTLALFTGNNPVNFQSSKTPQRKRQGFQNAVRWTRSVSCDQSSTPQPATAIIYWERWESLHTCRR